MYIHVGILHTDGARDDGHEDADPMVDDCRHHQQDEGHHARMLIEATEGVREELLREVGEGRISREERAQ